MAIRPTNNLRPAPRETPSPRQPPAPAGNGPTSPGRPAPGPDAARLRDNPAGPGRQQPAAALPGPGAEAPETLRQDRHGRPLDVRGHEPQAFGAPTSPPASVPQPPQWRNLTLEATRPQREMLRREDNHNLFEAPEMAPRRGDQRREVARREANGYLVEPLPGQALPPRRDRAENVSSAG